MTEPTLAWLALPVVLYMTIVFSSYMNLSEVIIALETDRLCPSGGGGGGGGDDCDDDAVSAAAALASSYVFLAESIAAVLMVGFLGGLSDRCGRRLVIGLALLGTVVECVGIVTVMRLKLSALYLCAATGVNGVFGSYCAFLMAASAFVADVHHRAQAKGPGLAAVSSSSASVSSATSAMSTAAVASSASAAALGRSRGFVAFEAMLNAGAVVGPLAGGWALRGFGPELYFLWAACVAAAALAFVVFWMPESLAPRDPPGALAAHYGACGGACGDVCCCGCGGGGLAGLKGAPRRVPWAKRGTAGALALLWQTRPCTLETRVPRSGGGSGGGSGDEGRGAYGSGGGGGGGGDKGGGSHRKRWSPLAGAESSAGGGCGADVDAAVEAVGPQPHEPPSPPSSAAWARAGGCVVDGRGEGGGGAGSGAAEGESRVRLSLVSVAFFLTYGNTVSSSNLMVRFVRGRRRECL